MGVILDRLYHFHQVTPEVARSAQPYLGFYAAFLKPHGLKSLINLRGENRDFGWWRSEKAAAATLGIAHFDVKLSSRNLPSRSGLTALFDAFARAAPPILMKCSGGQDRTGLAIALYLIYRRGAAALPDAEAQFALWPYLHRPKSYQLWLKAFPGYAVEQTAGGDIAEWARSRYEPDHFAAWLKDRGMEKSFRAFQAETG
jgi:hypothetical protein